MSTIDKAMAVLNAFSPEHPILGVTEIAKRIGQNKVVVHRLLKSLEQHGMIEQDHLTSRYRLGYGVMRLAGAKLASLDFVQVAIPHLRALRDKHGETSQLLVQKGAATVRIYVCQTHHSMRFAGNVGGEAPLHSSAAGKVMLAHAAPDTIDTLIAQSQDQFPEWPKADPVALKAELATIRSQGFGLDDQSFRKYLRAIAAPFFGPSGELLAVVSTGGPIVRMTDDRLDEISETVRDLGRAITLELGGIDPEHMTGAGLFA